MGNRKKWPGLLKTLFIILASAAIVVCVLYAKGGFGDYRANASTSPIEKAKLDTAVETTPTPVPVTPPPAEVKPSKTDINFDVKVDEKIFKGTVFIGDSITQGVSDYGFLEKKYVLAQRGLTIQQAPELLSSIAKLSPDKVFIMIGTDDLLSRLDGSKFGEKYGSFIRSIKDKLPNTKIYVQSIFPVSLKAETEKPLFNQKRMKEFNEAILKMAKDEGITYLDTASLFKNASGYLPDELSTDGIHLKFKCYKVWMDYLQKNT